MKKHFLALKKLLPKEIFNESEILRAHSGDKWFASHLPEIVALPTSTLSVSKILAYAFKHRLPVTPRGAGYGYVGGCVPAKGGIALSLAKMNQILEINSSDFVAVVEPGVLTGQLQTAVEKKNLFYPPDPASKADSSIGGNIATNAGGPRCLKYGVTRDYVLGLEVVLSDGRILNCGGRTHKNKTGFDLHRIFVGSEGLLGIVTKATLKLLPQPPTRTLTVTGFDDFKKTAKTMDLLFAKGFLPSALEIADAFTLEAAKKRTGFKALEGCRSALLVELDGQVASIKSELKSLLTILKSQKPLFVQKAIGDEACEKLWGFRREFSYALRDTGLTKLNEDVVVPRGRVAELLSLGAAIQKKYGVQVACFGHAGDGNIHVNVMLDAANPQQVKKGEEALDALFKGVLELGGSITGEHGIGLAKKKWWPLAVSPVNLAVHQELKKTFDPKGILNPGKFL